MKRPARWVIYAGLALGGLIATLCLALLLYGVYLATFLELPKSDAHPPLRLYSGPFLLKPNLSLTHSRLIERLQRLDYRQVTGPVQSPGDYQLTDQALTIYLHPQPEGQVGATTMVRLPLEQGHVTAVLSPRDGTSLFPLYLEPELLSGVRGESRQVREWIPLAQIPPQIIETVLTIEDRRFYSHFGIDPVAVGRALWINVTKGGVVQGGSTITQQLAKNLFYSPQRTMGRKFKEAMAALVLEVKYTKQEILESYLNEIYLGQAGFVSLYGVREAAHRYFGKTLQELTVEEIAMLAGLIKGPNSYAPTKHPELAKQRRDVVLRRLRETGLLTEEAWAHAVHAPLGVTPSEEVLTDAPYFVDTLLREVEEVGVVPLPEGLRIESTLDPMIQQAATEALEKGLARLEATHPHLKSSTEPVQGAVVVLDPTTGSVLALVGGRNYRLSQFNRAVQARRQPGSLFKPFVYLAALEAARGGLAGHLTVSSLLADEPRTFKSEAGSWSPQNYDKQFHGQVTVRTALEQSLNVPAVWVAKAVGTKPIVQLLHRLGVTSSIGQDLSSVALGSSSVSLLEITAAYGTIANGGIAVKPTLVRSTRDRQGALVWSPAPDRLLATSPQGAYVLTSLLEGVIQRGTASKANVLGWHGAVAGKTGTTDGYRDAWFVGYTSNLVIGVWVGYDDERPLRLTGSQAALPIWMDLARRVIPPNVPLFAMPPGVVTRNIDPKTGQLATFRCPEQVSEVFIEGTEPTIYCEVHGGGIWERLRHTFGFS